MKLFSATVLASVVALMGSVPVAAAVPTWRMAQEASLPNGASGIASGFLPALSCPSVGYCAAGGVDALSDGQIGGVVLNEVKGVWVAPVSLVAPAGADAHSDLQINWLSCGADNNCVAVGTYANKTGDLAFVADEVSGRWSAARSVALPANAVVNGQNALVRWVACPSANNCSAVGEYLGRAGVPRSDGFVVDEVNGVWRRSRTVRVSGTVNVNPFVTLNQVSCSTKGNCVVVGSYIDASDVQQGLVAREVDGVWHAASALALPLNASAYAATTVSEVDCVRAGPCTVAGDYLNHEGQVEALVDASAGGHWARAHEVTMPDGARSNPEVSNFGFRGLDCVSDGNCTLGGQYENESGQYEGFVANEVAGTWGDTQPVRLPGAASSVGKNGGVVAVTCPRVNNCRAGADYLDVQGNYQGLLLSEVNGVWQRGVKLSLPAGANTVGADGGVYALVCVTLGSCVATGSYETPAMAFEGFTVGT